MPTPNQIARAEFDRIIENLDHLTRRLNETLFEVLEYIGLKLFDLESVSMADVTAMFRMVASHVSLDDLDRATTSDYLREFRTNLRLFVTSRRKLKSPDLIEEYRHYSWTAGLFARSLAYHVEGKPLFRLPDYVHFDQELKLYMEIISDPPYIAARVLLLEQRKAKGKDLHLSEDRFDKLTLGYNGLRKGLSERARKQYLDNTDQFPCLEWKMFISTVEILTHLRYIHSEFIDELEPWLDKRRVPLSEASSYNGEDDNDDSEDTQHNETSIIALEASHSDSGSETSLATVLDSPPIYPLLWTFTTPCTLEATSAADAKDRRCYACYYNYGAAFSHTAQTEPAVRTSCGHVHGVICLENHCKTGKATCPLCRRNLFKFEQRLSPEAINTYNQLVRALEGCANLDAAADRYLLEGYKEVHDSDFGELLDELMRLYMIIQKAKSDLWEDVRT